MLSDEEKSLLTAQMQNRKLPAFQGVQKNPEQHAEVISLSEQTGLPKDTVERNTERIKKDNLMRDIERLQFTHPKTSAYMSSPDNVAISHDDLDALKGLEDSFKEKRGFWDNQWRNLLTTTNKLTGDFIQFSGRIGDSFADQMGEFGIPNPGITFGDDGISWHWDLPDEASTEFIGKAISDEDTNTYDYQPDFTWEKFKGEMTPTNLAGYIGEMGVQSIPHMFAALYTLPAYVSSRTQDIAESRAENDQRADVSNQDLVEAFIPAVTSALIERYASKVVLDVGGARTLKDIGKKAGMAALVEGGTEFLQEGVEYLGETAFTKKDLSLMEGLDRMVAGLVAGAGMGGGLRGATATAEAALNRNTRKMQSEIINLHEQISLDNIISYAQSAKTGKRNLKAYQQFIQTLTEDAVYLPESLVAELEGVPDYVTEKVTGQGTDIEIPMTTFLNETVNDEAFLEQIRDHIKITPDGLSRAEMQETDRTLEDMLRKAMEENQADSEIDAIYEQVKDQIVDTGRQNEQTAKYSAQLIPAYVKVKSEQLGISPMEVFEKMGVSVEKLKQEQETQGETIMDQSSQLEPEQDFGDIEIVEQRQLAETGETVTIRQSAQKMFDQTMKRKNVVNTLLRCLNE